MADFFISYTQADLDWARWVDFVLREAGYDTIIQEYDFQGNFIIEMDRALRECDHVLALLSPAYLKSVNCQREWSAALTADPTKPGGKLLPLRVVEMDVIGLLGPVIWHDLATAPSDRDAERRLFEAIKGKVRPTTRPSFPGRGRDAPAFPGGRPAHSNLPQRNPHFVGRADLLEALERQLNGGAVALTALSGLGGIGKSQTALHYAHTRTGLEIAWWLRAERPETMLGDLADLARHLGVAPEGNDVQMHARAALDELSRRDAWLLIYDNAESEADVYPWLPPAGGAAIITSRDDHWSRIGKLDVDKLAPADSVTLLLDLSGDTDEEAAAALAKDLDYLPLALEQAAAYAKVGRLGLASYLRQFTTAHSRLLAKGKPVDYPATVATTWDMSVDRVERENPASGQLLTLCAFLAADDIPLDLLRPGSGELPSPLSTALADPIETIDMVAALTSQSLVKVQADGRISLHRLVQMVQRNRLDEASHKDWAARAVRLLVKVYRFEENDLTTWEGAGKLLPHAEAAAGWGEAEAEGVEWRATSWLLDGAGDCLTKDGLYERGVEMRRRALALAEANLPVDDLLVATCHNNLAIAHMHAGQWAEAFPLLERALAIDESHYGPDHIEVATSLGNLAVVYRNLGQLEDSRALHERVLAMEEVNSGPDHPRVAPHLDNLAGALSDMGKFAEAETLRRRALAIDTAHYGDSHPKVADGSHNLAITIEAMGRLEEAREMMGRAVAIRQRYLVTDHPATILSRKLLAEIESRIAQSGGAAPSPHPSPTRGEGEEGNPLPLRERVVSDSEPGEGA